MSTTVTRDGKLFGWVRIGGCANQHCKRAIKQGRKFHAVPAGFAVTLSDYHFATEDDACSALLTLPSREDCPNPVYAK